MRSFVWGALFGSMELSRPKKKKPEKVADDAAIATVNVARQDSELPPAKVATSSSVVAALPVAPTEIPASLAAASLPAVPASMPSSLLVSSLPAVPSSLVVPAFPAVPVTVAEVSEHFAASSAPPLEELPDTAEAGVVGTLYYVSSSAPIYPKLASAALSDVDEEGLLRFHLPMLNVADEDDQHRPADDRFAYLLEQYRESVSRHVAAVEERDALGQKCWELEDQDGCWLKETRYVTEKRLCGDGVAVEERHEFTVAQLRPEKLKEVAFFWGYSCFVSSKNCSRYPVQRVAGAAERDIFSEDDFGCI